MNSIALPYDPSRLPSARHAVGLHRRFVARVIDLCVASMSMGLALFVVARTVDESQLVAEIGTSCAMEFFSSGRSCTDMSGFEQAQLFVGALPGSTIVLFMLLSSAALLWQWPLVARGGTIGQRFVDLRHGTGAARERIAGVLLWRQALLLVPVALALLDADGTVFWMIVLAAIAEAWWGRDGRTVTERLVGRVVEATPRTRTSPSPSPWAPPAPNDAAG